MPVLNYAPDPRTPLDCTHCGNRAMSAAKKLWVGPARSVRCKVCGQRVSVAWLQSLLVLTLGWAPFLIVGLYPVFTGVGSPLWVDAAAIGAFLVGAVAMFWLYVKFVPLVKR
jgi:hypothetical protein